MNIDGKTNVKERTKIFESDYFTTYSYKFENGNKYTDTVPKWQQRTRNVLVKHNPDERLDKNYWERL
ncbi:MAG: hypothetical protein IJ272_08055 [Clostridia bacterium]|nr:hypothetical protein [Clostridia bacterium]